MQLFPDFWAGSKKFKNSKNVFLWDFPRLEGMRKRSGGNIPPVPRNEWRVIVQFVLNVLTFMLSANWSTKDQGQ